MTTSSSTQGKPAQKRSEVLPSNYHLSTRQYVAHISYGGVNQWSEYFDTEDEAKPELRCMEKRCSYELIETTEGEGYFPERAIIIEEMYQQSGRTNGLYTGLSIANGPVSDDHSV